MYNLYNESNRRTAINTVLETSDACSTDIISLVQDQAINVSRASSLMLAPIFAPDPANPGSRVITGISSLVYSWDSVLNESVPSTSIDIDVVISGPKTVYTLRITGGKIYNLGPGDRHEVHGEDGAKYERVLFARAGIVFTIKARRLCARCAARAARAARWALDAPIARRCVSLSLRSGGLPACLLFPDSPPHARAPL